MGTRGERILPASACPSVRLLVFFITLVVIGVVSSLKCILKTQAVMDSPIIELELPHL